MKRINPALSLRLPIGRARVLLAGLGVAFIAVVARAAYLQTMHTDYLQNQGASRYARTLELPAHRGVITDRNGEQLAISTAMESVWATPALAKLDGQQIAQLSRILGVSSGELKDKLDSSRDFVYLKRHLKPDAAERVVQMRLPGISLKREYRRFYPAADVTGHLIGFTDVDDKGQEGLELVYQQQLAGKAGTRHVIQDRLGRVVEDGQGGREPVEGQDLQLSIDSRLQYMAYRELKAAVARHEARGGGIVVLDVKSGEVLAMANFPTYNPNDRATRTPDSARNRAITDLFEPGSTLKPFTVAAALEAHMVSPQTTVQTSPGYLQVGSARIHDAHPAGLLTVSQVIQRSSNVGVAKIALALPKQQLWGVLSAVGFGVSPHVNFPGEAGGRLRDYQRWRPIEQATLAYGHGISVSLLQLARAYTIFAGDGVLQSVSLLKRDAAVEGVRVLSPGTANAVRNMLETVVQPGGTAVRAQVSGYRVAGKTGTAHKLQGASYSSDRYVSSFVGMAPASDPRLIVAVMLDEPRKGGYYGGVVAAPVFSAVMGESLRALSVTPDAPVTPALPRVGPGEAKEEV